MFRIDHTSTLRGDAKRHAIATAALTLFRERGFDAVTMREVAAAAGVATGAAYYYFPSKESLVLDYYDGVQNRHRAAVVAALKDDSVTTLEFRLRAVLQTKLDLVSPDRRLLGALFRYVAEPTHPLSIFGEATRKTRDHAVATFALAIQGENLPSPLDTLAPRAAWLTHLGLLLYLVADTSPEQCRTRRLADRAACLLATALTFARLPGASVALTPLTEALREAGLLPSSTLETP